MAVNLTSIYRYVTAEIIIFIPVLPNKMTVYLLGISAFSAIFNAEMILSKFITEIETDRETTAILSKITDIFVKMAAASEIDHFNLLKVEIR